MTAKSVQLRQNMKNKKAIENFGGSHCFSGGGILLSNTRHIVVCFVSVNQPHHWSLLKVDLLSSRSGGRMLKIEPIAALYRLQCT